jgi:hypothetical protein
MLIGCAAHCSRLLWRRTQLSEVLDFLMDGLSGQAMVRSSWIVLTGEDFPEIDYLLRVVR